MTSATMTTHDSRSKRIRNAQPANTAAKSFAKFSGSPQPASAKPNAASASTPAPTGSQRRFQSGSAHRTSSSVAGMTTKLTSTMSHQSDSPGKGGAARNQARTAAPSAPNLNTGGVIPTTRRAA